MLTRGELAKRAAAASGGDSGGEGATWPPPPADLDMATLWAMLQEALAAAASLRTRVAALEADRETVASGLEALERSHARLEMKVDLNGGKTVMAFIEGGQDEAACRRLIGEAIQHVTGALAPVESVQALHRFPPPPAGAASAGSPGAGVGTGGLKVAYKVTVTSGRLAYRLLDGAHRLKGAPRFQGVFFQEDLTPAQRAARTGLIRSAAYRQKLVELRSVPRYVRWRGGQPFTVGKGDDVLVPLELGTGEGSTDTMTVQLPTTI